MKRKIRGIKERTIKTNMGEMPLKDYLDIAAFQCGFDDYEDLKRHGCYLDQEKEKYIRKRV